MSDRPLTTTCQVIVDAFTGKRCGVEIQVGTRGRVPKLCPHHRGRGKRSELPRMVQIGRLELQRKDLLIADLRVERDDATTRATLDARRYEQAQRKVYALNEQVRELEETVCNLQRIIERNIERTVT